MHNILSVSIILNDKFFTDTLDEHPPPNSRRLSIHLSQEKIQ